MRRVLKKLGIPFAVVCGLGLIIIAAMYARPTVMYARKLLIQAKQAALRRQASPMPAHEVPEQRARIDGLVTQLERESWDQSIENVLTNSDQFTGVNSARSGDQVELEQMLSARRAVKLLNTLEALPMNKRVEKCRELFDRVMRVYGLVYEDLAVSGSGPWEPPIQQRGRYHPTEALCLAMFATAETGRRDILAEQFQRLDDLRHRVERRMDDNQAAYCYSRRRMILNRGNASRSRAFVP
jgi:hypothetical protein